MPLSHGGHLQAGNVVAAARFQAGELDRRAQLREFYWKARRAMLAPQGFLQGGVASVDPDAVPGDVSRPKERESHDVVPVHMGEKDVERVGACGAVLGKHVGPEGANPAPEIAQDILAGSGLDLHTRGIPTKGVGGGELQLALDEGAGLFGGIDPPPRSAHEGRDQLLLDGG